MEATVNTSGVYKALLFKRKRGKTGGRHVKDKRSQDKAKRKKKENLRIS